MTSGTGVFTAFACAKRHEVHSCLAFLFTRFFEFLVLVAARLAVLVAAVLLLPPLLPPLLLPPSLSSSSSVLLLLEEEVESTTKGPAPTPSAYDLSSCLAVGCRCREGRAAPAGQNTARSKAGSPWVPLVLLLLPWILLLFPLLLLLLLFLAVLAIALAAVHVLRSCTKASTRAATSFSWEQLNTSTRKGCWRRRLVLLLLLLRLSLLAARPTPSLPPRYVS